MSVSSEWIKLGDSRSTTATYYKKKEIYSLEWIKDKINLDDYLISVAKFGGAIAMTRDPNKALIVTSSEDSVPWIFIYSSSGRLISKFVFNKGTLLCMGWTYDDHLILIATAAQVYVSDMNGNLKTQVGFTERVRDSGILFIQTWETGIALVSNDLETWVITDIDYPVCEKYSKITVTDIPFCMEVVVTEHFGTPDILIAPKTGSLLLNSNDRVRDYACRFGPFLKIASSPTGNYLAMFSKTGTLHVTSSDLVKNVSEFNTKSLNAPTQLVWCGEDSVCLYWSPEVLKQGETSLVLMIGPGGYQKWTFEGTIHLVGECDGVRILTNEGCEFLQKVPGPNLDIFRIGSLEATAQLFDCYKEFEETRSIQMHIINAIRDQLPKCIKNCLEAACHEFDLSIQRKLVAAASFGKSFLQFYDQKVFVSTAKVIRVMNAVRDSSIGIPLSYSQYLKLTPRRLIQRLLRRGLHYDAFKLCKFINVKPSTVVEDWAIQKIKSNAEEREIFETIMEKMDISPDSSYAKLASIALDQGKKKLSLGFLELEKSSGDQVPILMKMKEYRPALQKAIESGESDLIYLVLLDMREKMDPQQMFKLIVDPQFELAKNLLITYSKEQDIEYLKILLQSMELPQDAAAMYLLESTNVKDPHTKRRLIKQAKDLLVTKKDCYVDAKICGEQIDLVNIQGEFDVQNIKKKYPDLSVSKMIETAILDRDDKKAEYVRNTFGVPDKRFWHIRINCLAKMGAWEDLNKFSNYKKSPIGYGPFVQVCLDYDNQTEALKYIGKVVEPRDKVEYSCALGMWKEAYEFAASKKDARLLAFIGNKSRDPVLKTTIQNLLKKM